MLSINVKAILFLLTVILCAGQLSTYGQAKSEQEQAQDNIEKCFKQPNLLSDDSGKTILFSASQMKNRAVNKVLPPPAHFRGKGGNAVVKILVNAEGKVECAVTLYGHPLIKVASMRAAKQWTFKPLKKNGKFVAYVGLIEFHFESGKVSY